MFKTIKFVVVFKVDGDAPQEEKEFNVKQAAEDYAQTVRLLGGVAIVVPKEVVIGTISNSWSGK